MRVPVAAFVLAVCLGVSDGASSQDAGSSPDGPLFGQPFAEADFETLSAFRLGRAVFRQEWAPAGGGPPHFDGLGPLFNARSCAGCHVEDGRGRPPEPDGGTGRESSMIVKLGRPGAAGRGLRPDPFYGRQLQDFATGGIQPEGSLRPRYDEQDFIFSDGEAVRLRRPRHAIAFADGPPAAPDTVLSARIAPPVIGLGLISRVAEADIRAGADPDDRDRDGISGRVNIVESPALGRSAIGRFGWKSGQATLEDQISLAFSLDMGIATPLFPDASGDCTAPQLACRTAPDGRSAKFENLEAHSVIVGWLVRYVENVAPAEPRGAGDPDHAAGRELFGSVGCAACHRPSFMVPPDPDQPHLGGREAHAYTDLLLHDMGEGLADRFGEGEAGGGEWRTAPLWGVGLAGEVNGNEVFLHDGRARSVLEAILWHGGEAAAARNAFVRLDRADRARLVGFVNSL